MKTVSRVRAAELADVDPRTITRWAGKGWLVRYLGPRGDVQFSEEAVRKLRKDPDDKQVRTAQPPAREESAPRNTRW
jgi:hypothetical protein